MTPAQPCKQVGWSECVSKSLHRLLNDRKMQPGHRDPLEKSASKVGQVNKNLRYDANFKIRKKSNKKIRCDSQRRGYRGPQTGWQWMQ